MPAVRILRGQACRIRATAASREAGAAQRREETEPVADAPEPESDEQTQVDISAVARLCMEIARVETPSTLERLLKRASHVFGASRVTLWIGAGDELFPIVTHAADSAGSSTPEPLPRTAEHPAARAWRLAAVGCSGS